MSPVQTTYNVSQDIGYVGQVIEHHEVATFWSEGGVYPGRACIKGTATTSVADKYNDRNIPFGVKTPGDAGDVIIGLPILTARLLNDTGGDPYYDDESIVAVLKKGSMFVLAGEAVAVRDPVYSVYSVGDSALPLGSLIKDAVAGTTGAAILVPHAYWKNASAAGKINQVVLGSDPEVV